MIQASSQIPQPPERLREFVLRMKDIGNRVRAESGAADIAHLRRMERWGRLCSLIGYATAWLVPNPVSAFLMSQGNLTRWMVMHHVGHGGYNHVPGVPKRYTSHAFARGWRRWLEWPDWMTPEAWNYEHNRLHHYSLNEAEDPDLVQRNVAWLRQARLPRALKYTLVAFAMMSWKWFYYAPSTMRELHNRRQQVTGVGGHERPALALSAPEEFETGTAYARAHFASMMRPSVWLNCYLPYASLRFVLLPLLFAPLGGWAVLSVLLNSLLAELVTNVHTFIVIVPNHAGDDLPAFTDAPADFDENLIRQVIGSVNFRTGGDMNDFAHMWLNYQIEHHVWPAMTMAGYQRAQPELRALCEEFGVPYIQHSVWYRLKQTIAVMLGDGSHPIWHGTLLPPPPERPRESNLSAA
jgi:fatty acid desaturase